MEAALADCARVAINEYEQKVAELIVRLIETPDYRLAGAHVLLGMVVDAAELGVAVGVLPAFDGLGACLQAEAFLPQQVPDVSALTLEAREGQGGHCALRNARSAAATLRFHSNQRRSPANR